MQLTTITHTGRRVSYQALVQIVYVDEAGDMPLTARVRDETGLWEAIVEVDERLAQRLDAGEMPAYFWARLRGGDIDLRDREIDPEWDSDDG